MSISATLTSVGTIAFSFCKPSRGPTSHSRTARGSSGRTFIAPRPWRLQDPRRRRGRRLRRPDRRRAKFTATTTPAAGAAIVCSIFIASSTISGAPFSTDRRSSPSRRRRFPTSVRHQVTRMRRLFAGVRKRVDARQARARSRRENVQHVTVADHARGEARLDIGCTAALRRDEQPPVARVGAHRPRLDVAAERDGPVVIRLDGHRTLPRRVGEREGDPVRRRAVPPRIGSVPRRMRIGGAARDDARAARSMRLIFGERRGDRARVRRSTRRRKQRVAMPRRSVPCRRVPDANASCATTRSRNATLVATPTTSHCAERVAAARRARAARSSPHDDQLREHRIVVRADVVARAHAGVDAHAVAARPASASARCVPIDGRKPRSGSSA